jgi:tetratricopeptide (TPR) repeat protein
MGLTASAVAQEDDCEPQDPTTAEVNVREAVRLAKQKRFADALPLFRVAVRLDGCAPEHHLLLARGLARMEKWDESRENYETVLARFPQSPEAARAKQELSELELARLKANTPKGGAGKTVADTTSKGPSTTDWIGYGLLGAGALSLVGGVVFALDAQQADDDLALASIRPNRAAYDELVDQRESSSTLAWTFYGLGAALIVGGVVTAFVLDDPAPTKGQTGLAVYGDGQQLGVTWGGQF